MRKMESEIRYVAATGALGVGVHVESLEKSLDIAPAFIAADAGTTDAGPFSLGMGVPAFAREAVKRDLGIKLRTAVIRSEQSKDYLLRLYREGRIRALDPAPPLSEQTLERSARIVGMMGIEPLQDALQA